MAKRKIATLGFRIRKFRRKHNLTQVELADKLNLRTPYIEDVESNVIEPPIDVLFKIAHELKTTIAELRGDQPRVYDKNRPINGRRSKSK